VWVYIFAKIDEALGPMAWAYIGKIAASIAA